MTAAPVTRGTRTLAWWYTHRQQLDWVWRVLRIAALIVGAKTVGFWFGIVLALVVWLLLPAAILWPLLKQEERRSGVTPEGFRRPATSVLVRLLFAFAIIIGSLLIVYGNRF